METKSQKKNKSPSKKTFKWISKNVWDIYFVAIVAAFVINDIYPTFDIIIPTLIFGFFLASLLD